MRRIAIFLFVVFAFSICQKATAQPVWGQYSGNPQHTGISSTTAQLPRAILWQTPVDLFPPYAGPDLLIHYGSSLIAAGGTAVVTVRTGPNANWPTTNDTFRIEGHDHGTGKTLWVENTDFTDPPHDWVPTCGSAISPGNVLYTPGAGGTVLMRSNADSAGANVSRLCFYGLSKYQADTAGYNANVQICTPISVDGGGNIFFGFYVASGWNNSATLSSGIAKITPSGVGSWVSADQASLDAGDEVATNCAPAFSNDGKYLYVAVKQQGGYANPMLLRLSTANLSTVSAAALSGPNATNGDTTFAYILDDASSTPMVGPDGDVYYGIWFGNLARGFMLHYSADLSQTKTAGAFGWDDTASVVPASCVPSYTGSSTYLILTKYNNYADAGINGDGLNKVAILDPNATETYTETYGNGTFGDSYITMKEILTVLGPTVNMGLAGVREWCINDAAVDVAGKAVIINSEDGISYRWDLTTNTLTQSVMLAPPTGEAYTPTVIDGDGISYAVNNANVCAMWDGVKVSKVSLNANSFIGGDSTSGTVSLTDLATGPGARIVLSSNNPNLHVPASASIGSGQNSAPINITSKPIDTNETAIITASRYGFSTNSTSITLKGSGLSSVTLGTNQIYGNQSSSGTISLIGPAPKVGRTVTLSSDLPSITFPKTTVSFPGGASNETFAFSAMPVFTTASGHIIATLDDGMTLSTHVTNNAVGALARFTVDNSRPYMSYVVTGMITLAGPVGVDSHAQASASDAFVHIVTQPTVPAGKSQGSFAMETESLAAASNHNTTVTVMLNGLSLTQTITIQPIGLSSLSISPNMIQGGQSAMGTVSVTKAAGPAGLIVGLSSSSSLVILPKTITVQGGNSTASFSIRVSESVQSTVRVPVYANLAGTQRVFFITLVPSGGW